MFKFTNISLALLCFGSHSKHLRLLLKAILIFFIAVFLESNQKDEKYKLEQYIINK